MNIFLAVLGPLHVFKYLDQLEVNNIITEGASLLLFLVFALEPSFAAPLVEYVPASWNFGDGGTSFEILHADHALFLREGIRLVGVDQRIKVRY